MAVTSDKILSILNRNAEKGEENFSQMTNLPFRHWEQRGLLSYPLSVTFAVLNVSVLNRENGCDQSALRSSGTHAGKNRASILEC